MLRWRLAGAAAIILPVLLLLWLDDQHNFGRPGIWFAPLAIAVGCLCCLELTALLRQGGLELNSWAAGLAGLVAMLIATVPQIAYRQPAADPVGRWGWPMLGLVAAMAVIMLDELRRFQSGTRATERIAMEWLAVFYVVIPFNFLFQLRMWSPDRLGLLSFVSVVFVAKFSDSGAYFVGRSVGKNQLAPQLSPKKTVEGAVGGLLVAVLAGAVFLNGILPWLCPSAGTTSWWGIVAFALSIALIGMLGDLSISLFKRDVGQKDSADWLPGLGGCLDVLDSVLWAAPVGYLWWVSGCLAG